MKLSAEFPGPVCIRDQGGIGGEPFIPALLMRHRLLFSWLALFCYSLLLPPAQAQQRLAQARQQSYLTKVFRLTEAQTRYLYERGLGAARPDFFTQVVDSFPTARPQPRRLPLGYYLTAHADGPRLVYELRAETDREVVVLDNQVDLTLVVRDSLGRPLPDAQVALAGRPVAFDPATHSYRQARGGRAGLLAVTYQGRTTFHPVSQTFPRLRQALVRSHQRISLGQVGWRLLYGFPLGYLTRPVRHLVRDLRYASEVSTGLVGLLRSPFNEDVRDERQERRDDAGNGLRAHGRWASYVATSQPRYRPTGDTLRLKARVLRRTSGRPCRQPLTLWLGGGDRPDKRLATLRPTRPGTYLYTLPLTDTLGLRSDTYVGFRLVDAHERTVASGQFRLEDYELGNTHYTLRVAEKTQRQGQPQAVFVRGTDANDLNLLDARLRLSLTPAGAPGALAGRHLFVPDTLWTTTRPLEALGETRLDVPAAVLPDADLAYQVHATFLTADQERRTERTTVDLRRDPGELRAELRGDSVYLAYRHQGQPQAHAATLHVASARAVGGNWLFRGPMRLPCAVRVDAQAVAYELRDADGRAARLELAENNAGLTLRSDRPADSLVLAVDNPRRLPFWYYLYQDNRLRYRGYGPDLRLAVAHAGTGPWFASLHYWWGGKLRSAEYTVARPAPQLVVTAEEPAVAYPGQRIGLRFAVTDEQGRPVPNADLTSYAHTSKFEASTAPHLPVLQTARPVVGRQSLRRFRLDAGQAKDNLMGSAASQPLPWAQWRHVLGLDSLQFYQFLYPATGFFHEYRPAPGGLAQVAAFVVDSGRVQAPLAVYVDGQPGYLRAVNEYSPYTVVADSGHHTLRIRTATRLITLRDVYLRPLHKLTLSIDVNRPCRELTVEKRPATLDANELLALRRSLVVLDDRLSLPVATLRQGRVLRPLTQEYYGGLRCLVSGPFRPDSVLLRAAGGLRRRFMFEPLFRYSFGPGLLKMQCLDESLLGPLNQSRPFHRLPLADFAYTEADFSRQAPQAGAGSPYYLNYLSPSLDAPTSTPTGHGRLELRRPPPIEATPGQPELPASSYVLLTRPDQPKFVRLAWGTALLHDLPPGRYRVAVLLADSSCLAPVEDIVVQANGQTYYQLRLTDRIPAGALSHRIHRLLWARRWRSAAADVAPTRSEIRVEMPAAPQPGWRTVRGQVLAQQSGEGLPGVTVLLCGTTVGTSTAADGSFSLQVPPGSFDTLRFSYIGYRGQEVALGGQNVLTISLEEEIQALNEVVVVGYGTARSSNLTGAVSSVSSVSTERLLRGRVPGVRIVGENATPGATTAVVIRGASTSNPNSQPLIILDGLPFNGRLADLDPATIASLNVLDGEKATSIYGARAANGLLIIKTKAASGPEAPGTDPRLAMRRHFRDYAWWRPLLLTDARGQASTELVLPDDVTSWDTFVLASDDHGRLGHATGRVRAFKQLRAELATPRFLVAGDRTQLLGKSLNYGFDTVQVTTTFRLGPQVLRTQARQVSPVALDTLTFTAPAAPPTVATPDSVQLSYALAQPSGYQDGEQRRIPVLPAGTLERVGRFATLTATDTTVHFPVDPALGEVTLRLESDALPVLLSEIAHLQSYAYLCNEQAASKLKALLLEARIRAVQQQPFRGERAVRFLVRKLLQGQPQPAGLWGTWPGTAASPWATTHVLEALLDAEKAGYKVTFDRGRVQDYLLRELDDHLGLGSRTAVAALHGYPLSGAYHAPDDLIRLLALLHRLGAPTDFATYLARFDRLQRGRQPLDRYLALVNLRQQLGLPYQLDTLRRYRLSAQLGGIYYADTLHAGTYCQYLLRDQVGATLLAYRALRTHGGHDAELVRLRSGLLNLRQGGYWASTYETAQILETIGPDLFAPGQATVAAKAHLSGGLNQTVTQFPFTARLAATSGALTLRKEGLLPVYATAYQSRWNPVPAPVAAAFTVHTSLAGQPGTRVVLRAGQPAELLVTVDVKSPARYVLVEVPIPAGCSYATMPAAPHPGEVHREYLRHQTGIFLDALPIGRHQFRIALQPRFRGTYTVNPAKAELVYFPTKFGRSASKQAVVE